MKKKGNKKIPTPRQEVIHNPIPTSFCKRCGFESHWYIELIFPSFFPSYLSSSPSDLHTPPFFQSTRREIGSETTDNLSEDNPVKNAYRASVHALILTHPYIVVMLKTVALFVMI